MEKTDKLNILLFGMAGSSKSSFINSCYTLLSNKLESQIAQSGGDSVRVTKELVPYRLVAPHNEAPTTLMLVDTWGVEQNVDHYNQGQFELILKGKLPKNWHMKDDVTGSLKLQDNRSSSEIHCLIIFVPAGELVSGPGKGSFMLSKTKEFCATATRLKIPFIVLLSKIDIQVPAFRANPTANFPDITKLVNQAAQTFAIAPAQVYPLINYYSETEKTFHIDQLTFRILDVARSIAKNTRLTDNLRNIIFNDDF